MYFIFSQSFQLIVSKFVVCGSSVKEGLYLLHFSGFLPKGENCFRVFMKGMTNVNVRLSVYGITASSPYTSVVLD